MGQIILQLRKEKSVTQEELAKAVKVSPQAVSKWENGGTPDTELLPEIADYFNIPIDRLFGRSSSPNIGITVHEYVYEPGQFAGFDRAFNIYHALHGGLVQPGMFKLPQGIVHSYQNCDENGYSLMISNGYGNLVKREFWESINLETASFAQELFTLLTQSGMLEILFAILRRNVFGPANFQMIKSALVKCDYSDEEIQTCLNELVEREILSMERSSYEEIGETYQLNDQWYLGLCAVICATQALKISVPEMSGFLGRGAWPITL